MRKRRRTRPGLVQTFDFHVILLAVMGLFAAAGPPKVFSAGVPPQPEHQAGPLTFVQFDDCAARFADALRRWPVVDRAESPVILASPQWKNETSVAVKDGSAFVVQLGETITMRSGAKVRIAMPGASGCHYATEVALVSATDSRGQPMIVLRFSVTRPGLGSPVLKEVYTVRKLSATRPAFSFFGRPASRPSEPDRAARMVPASRPREQARTVQTAPVKRPALSLFGRPASRPGVRTGMAQASPVSQRSGPIGVSQTPQATGPAFSLFSPPAGRPSGSLRVAQTAPTDRVIAFQHGKVLLKAGMAQERVTVLGECTWRDGSGRLCVELKLQSRSADTPIDVAGRYISTRDGRAMRLPQATRLKLTASNPTPVAITFPKTAKDYEIYIAGR